MMRLLQLLPLLFLLAACSSSKLAPKGENPPPARALSQFGSFELREALLGEGLVGLEGADEARATVTRYLEDEVEPILNAWNEAGQSGPTLLIEPEVVAIQRKETQRAPSLSIGLGVGGGSGSVRTSTGVGVGIPLGEDTAGDIEVLLRVRLADAETTELIATPEFYQAGGTGPLRRTVELFASYLTENFPAPVGGPSQ